MVIPEGQSQPKEGSSWFKRILQPASCAFGVVAEPVGGATVNDPILGEAAQRRKHVSPVPP